MNSESKNSGTAGLRWVQCSINGAPSSSPAIICCSAAYSWSKRRMKPTWIRRRPSSVSRLHARHAVAASVVSGFSHSTGLPGLEAGQDLLLVRRPGAGDHDGVDVVGGDRRERVGDHPGADRVGDAVGLLGREVADHGDAGAPGAPRQALDVERSPSCRRRGRRPAVLRSWWPPLRLGVPMRIRAGAAGAEVGVGALRDRQRLVGRAGVHVLLDDARRRRVQPPRRPRSTGAIAGTPQGGSIMAPA